MWVKRIPVEVEADGFYFAGNVLLIAVNNGIYFGSGLGIAPDARIDDGKANIVIARKVSILQFLYFMPSLKRAEHIHYRELFYHEVSQCTITSSVPDCPIEMDGEVIGRVPITLTVLKHAVKTLKI